MEPELKETKICLGNGEQKEEIFCLQQSYLNQLDGTCSVIAKDEKHTKNFGWKIRRRKTTWKRY
jgi:hypothetical protein